MLITPDNYTVIIVVAIIAICMATFTIGLCVSLLLKKKFNQTIKSCLLNGGITSAVSVTLLSIIILLATPGIMNSYNDQLFNSMADELTSKYNYVITTDDVRNIYDAGEQGYSFKTQEVSGNKTNTLTGWMENGNITIKLYTTT